MNIPLSTRQTEDALYEVSYAEASHGVSEVFPLPSSVHEMMVLMSPTRAVAEPVVRIKAVVIVARKVILLLLLAAPKEQPLLSSVGVQKVLWLSSCSWMNNIYKKTDGKLTCYGLATLGLGDIIILL